MEFEWDAAKAASNLVGAMQTFEPHFVIPGRRGAANPESMNTGLWNMDSGFGPQAAPE